MPIVSVSAASISIRNTLLLSVVSPAPTWRLSRKIKEYYGLNTIKVINLRQFLHFKNYRFNLIITLLFAAIFSCMGSSNMSLFGNFGLVSAKPEAFILIG